MVLHSMPQPAWLARDAPHSDIVLSSRIRVMRNLQGYRFPHTAPREELLQVSKRVIEAVASDDFVVFKNLSFAERDHLVGCRLMSPDFPFNETGRAILLDKDRSTSMMVNEEDHIRLQVLTGGWSAETAQVIADRHLDRLGRQLDFAHSPRYGYLAASPYNAGEGQRISAMFHLIGLAHTRRLPNVLKALSLKNIASRGLFGESSRAIGAFVQVSITDGRRSEFIGACDYLLREERSARKDVGREEVAEKARQAIEYAIGSNTISLADSFRVLGWARWAAVAGLDFVSMHPRDVDTWLTTVELKSSLDDDKSTRARAAFLRDCLENG